MTIDQVNSQAARQGPHMRYVGHAPSAMTCGPCCITLLGACGNYPRESISSASSRTKIFMPSVRSARRLIMS